MQIQKRENKKRNLIIAGALLFLTIGAGLAWFLYSQPIENNKDTASSEKRTDDSRSDKRDKEGSSSSNSDAPETNPTSTEDTSTPTQGVVTPSTPPANNEPYPITNEHFQIRQISNTNFEITLYPVINNPEYADYNSQLRAYKKEALNYLEGRHGSIEGFGIDWSPDDAKNL